MALLCRFVPGQKLQVKLQRLDISTYTLRNRFICAPPIHLRPIIHIFSKKSTKFHQIVYVYKKCAIFLESLFMEKGKFKCYN